MREMSRNQRELLEELVRELDGEYRMQCVLDKGGERYMRVFIEWDKGPKSEEEIKSPRPEREGTL